MPALLTPEACVDHHDITLWFKDKTSLNFSIEAGFTLKPQYSDWKSGEQRIVRSWRRIHNRALFEFIPNPKR